MDIQSNNSYLLSKPALFQKDSNFNESIASPIFPSKSEKIGQSTIYIPPNYRLGVPTDSRFDSLPSPLSAYTISPALTSFSNMSHYDTHEEPLFPNAYSTNASPLIAPYDDGQLLLDELKQECTKWGSSNDNKFSPAVDFASLDIDPKQMYGYTIDDAGSVSEIRGCGTPVATYFQGASTASDEVYEDSESECSIIKIKIEPCEIDDTPLFNIKYDDDDVSWLHLQYGIKDLPIASYYATTMATDNHHDFGAKSLPSVKVESQSPPHINLALEALRSPSFEPEYLPEAFLTDESDGDFEINEDDSVYDSENASEDDEFTIASRPHNYLYSAKRRNRRLTSTNPPLHTTKISKSKFGEFVCPSCTRSFSRRFNLATHMQTHDSHRERPFACPNCASTFVRQHDLTRHASVHAATKPHKCAGCGTAFSRRDAMLRHIMQRCKCAKAAERAEKEAIERMKEGVCDVELRAAAAGLSRGRGRRRKGVGMSIQKTEIQLLHEDPEAKKVIEEAFRMQRELMMRKRIVNN
ncbi:hypothetical protein HK096_004711 [Nowakowskiella sp. JEL0078]|nr:hypothetical protein HK096_004711 [Nowakowskiella sp. JEL0078]